MLPLATAFVRRALLLCAILLVLPRLSAAQDQRAVLEVIVNDMPGGEALVVMRGSDVWIGVVALTRAGLHGFDGRRDIVGGQELVSLRSLAPAVAFWVDEAELRLMLTVSPDLLGKTVRSLSGGAPRDMVYRTDTSGFINYSVNLTNGKRLDFFNEAAGRVKNALVYNTVSMSGGTATRGITNVTIDERQTMRRWTIGDNLAYTGPLGGDSWIAGVTVARDFAIDPYFVRHPTLSLSTPIAVPSVMEVQVNGQTVSQERVEPGRVDLRNLPLTLGRNDARIVVRDAFGGTRELETNYYLTTSALAPGVHDYQYSVGYRREGVGTKSWDYKTPVALARHRVGVTDTLTLGGRAEVQPGHLASGGPSVNVRLPLGEIEAATSMSHHEGAWGTASHTAFNYVGQPVGGGGSVTVASRQYATLTPNFPGEDPAVVVNGYASASIGRHASVTLQHNLARLHQGITRERSGLLSTLHVARNVELTASVTRVHDEKGRGREFYAGLTYLFGRGSASLAHLRDSRGSRMAVDAQQSLPAGVGYGYQVRAEGGQGGRMTGVAQYQGQHGRYEARQESIGGQSATTISAMGAVVGIGGGVYATRPVQDSFALVRVPGVEGVRAFASNQEVGRTGRNGTLLVPDLQAYYGNLLSIADGDVPLDYAIPEAGMTLAPPYRGGAVATFPVRLVNRILGTVHVADANGDRVPQYGELTVTANGQSSTSPLGGDGSFYFENLPAGQHLAVVTDAKGTCEFVLEVPASKTAIIQLGALRCAAKQKQP